MKTIQLSNGHYAMVDDEDYPILSRMNWCLLRDKKTIYAHVAHNLKGTSYLSMHRIVMGFVSSRIDHIDGNGLNNQKSNLRPCTHGENMMNRKIYKHSSKFKGVSKFKNGWHACIRKNKKRIFLGNFKDEREAAMAYDTAAILHFGQFARTNQMEGVL